MAASRARKILDELVATRQLTPAGLAWLTLAVDPWHDTAVTGLEGLPDQGIGKSVSFQVVQELNISKNTSPGTLPAGNWQCRIGNFPILTPEQLAPGLFYGDVCFQDNTNAQLLQSVAVQYEADGVDFQSTGVYSVFPANQQGVSLPVEYTKGVMKIIGVGIEVINTTSSLHKQGLASFCRMVQPDSEPYTSYIAITAPPGGWSVKTVTPVRALPKNIAEMALYPGFAQHEAGEGYYAPVLLKFNRHRHFPVPQTTLLLDDDPEGGPFDVTKPIVCHTTGLAPLVIPGNATTFYSSRDLPLYYDCDSNVVVFSGLSDETTLTLRVRYICERFPNDAEKQMLVIATPSAVYDPVALEIYSRAAQRLPAGVPFSENPAGEWWVKMLETIAEVATPFLTMVHPGLGIASGAVAGISGAAARRMKESRHKKESKIRNGNVPPAPKAVLPASTGKIPASPQARAKLPKQPRPSKL